MSDSEAAAEQASDSGRLDAAVQRATDLTQRTLALFPVRVWRHFLQHNGFLLAAGVSYQALFAIFAAIYLAFAIAGLWLGGNAVAVDALIDVINRYIPNLITDTSTVITPDQVREIATGTTNLFTITGAVALGTVIWTAIGWVTFSRKAVRDIFGLDPDLRSYAILKTRDFFAALIFGLALLLGSLLSSVSAAFLSWLLEQFGWDAGSGTVNVFIQIGTVIVSFAILSTALAAMVRFLTGTALKWRTIWPGAVLGGAAMTVLQYAVGFLLSYTPSNPLLATFAIFIGLLLWFRINGVVMLVAAAWIAVSAQDRDLPLLQETEAQRRAAEHQALLAAASIRLRDATDAHDAAPWYRRWTTAAEESAAARALADLDEQTDEIMRLAAESTRLRPALPRRARGGVGHPR